MIEFQSTVDRYMAVRMLEYLGLLYQDLIRTHQLGQSGRLPPVLPIVPYNGLLVDRMYEWAEEAEQPGRQEGEAQLLMRLLRTRFGDLPD